MSIKSTSTSIIIYISVCRWTNFALYEDHTMRIQLNISEFKPNSANKQPQRIVLTCSLTQSVRVGLSKHYRVFIYNPKKHKLLLLLSPLPVLCTRNHLLDEHRAINSIYVSILYIYIYICVWPTDRLLRYSIHVFLLDGLSGLKNK